MGGGVEERIGQDNPRCFLVYGLLVLFVSFVLKNASDEEQRYVLYP